MRLPDTIETQRLLLRKPQPSDAAIIFRKYAQDPEVARYMIWTPHRASDETEQFIAGCRERWDQCTEFSYVLSSKSLRGKSLSNTSDGELLGMLSVRPTAHGIDIGYVLARTYWGRGLMPEAVSTLIQFALYTLDYFRIQASCDIDNKASARVMEKAGMIREGVLRRYIVHPNISAEPRDCYLYAATK